MLDMKVIALVGSFGMVSGAAGMGARWLLTQAGAPAPIASLGEWFAVPGLAGAFGAGGAYFVTRFRVQMVEKRLAEMESRITAVDARIDQGLRDRVHIGEFGALKEEVKGKAEADVCEVYEHNAERLLTEAMSKNEHRIYVDGVRREIDEIKGDIKDLVSNKVSEHRLNNALTPVTGTLSEVKADVKELRQRVENYHRGVT